MTLGHGRGEFYAHGRAILRSHNSTNHQMTLALDAYELPRFELTGFAVDRASQYPEIGELHNGCSTDASSHCTADIACFGALQM